MKLACIQVYQVRKMIWEPPIKNLFQRKTKARKKKSNRIQKKFFLLNVNAIRRDNIQTKT